LTNFNLLDKDRAYSSQSHVKVRWHCPICRLTKIPRQCQIHETPSSFHWHLKREHFGYVGYKFSYDDLVWASNGVVKGIEWGLFVDPDNPVEATTTSSSSQNGSYFRRDRHEKLEKIANLLKIQSELFPHFKLKQLMGIIMAILGKVDDRTIKKYLGIIISMSEKDIVHGTIDVTLFCNTFGV